MMTSRLRRCLGDDREAGFALVLVLGFTGVLAALIAVGTTIGIRTLKSSRAHVNFESALASAEAGVDDTLSKINVAYNDTPSTTYTPAAACNAVAPASFANEEAERTWARDQLTALPDSCLKTAGGGQYVAVRPPSLRAVYSMAWFPSRGAPNAKKRLIKAEYLFAPYKPTNAVLTQGSLDFSGSVAVTTLSTTPSDIHTNSNVTGYNSSLSVAGGVSASGALPSGGCPANVTGGCTSAAAIQTLPAIKARKYYDTQAATYSTSWYDLCPDGTVRSPAPATASVPFPEPCSGTSVGGSGSYGWEYTAGSGTVAPLWTLPRTSTPYPGTYYVYQGDAKVGDNGNSSTTLQISVLAEAKRTGITNPATCDKLGGNIEWKLFNLTPRLPGLQFLAEANLTGGANADAGSGLFLAGDKVDLNTSSSTITGAVVAANSCAAAGPNTIQGVTIRYDDTMESPLSDLIRTSLWLEYPAG